MKPITTAKESNEKILKQQKRTNLLLYLLGLILYIGGIVSISYYPGQAHKTYMSENALLPGVAKVEFEQSDILDSIRYSQEFQKQVQLCPQRDSRCRYQVSQWIDTTLKDIGLESYQHTFNIQPDYYNQSYTTSTSSNSVGYNLYSVIRAPKSDGTESLVLSTKFSIENKKGSDDEVNSVGLLLSIVSNLQRKARVWLAKDIVVVITDGHFGGLGMKTWLSDYHSNIHSRATQFRRAGMIQAALNIDIQQSYKGNRFNILSEGSNGQLPNLDLINTIGRMAMKERSRDRVHIALSESSFAKYFPREMSTLVTFMSNQALGVPTGDHGLFNRYHIDAVTIALPSQQGQHVIYQNSVIIIGTLRSLNNLLEHLHQSFYYYLLPSPYSYISIGEYMITLGCILAPLVVLVLVLLVSLSTAFKPPSLTVIKSSKSSVKPTTTTEIKDTNDKADSTNNSNDNDTDDNNADRLNDIDTPFDILYSTIIVSLTLVVGLACYSIPLTFSRSILSILEQLAEQNSQLSDSALFIGFILLYIHLFSIVYPRFDRYFINNSNNNSKSTTTTTASIRSKYLGGMSFKVFTCLPVLLFISTMSLLNFSFCTIAAILTVPLCIIPQRSNYSIIRVFQSIITLMISPPLVIYLISKFYLNQNVYTLIATLIRQHQMYSNLFFPFITLVYIPLNILTLKLINAKSIKQ